MLRDGASARRDLIARWLTDYADIETRPKTAKYYRAVNRLYIEPTIGNIRIQKLSPGDVQRVLNAARANGLSETTVRRVYAVIHKALKCALECEVASPNVSDSVKAPREAPHEVNPPDISIAKELLDKAMKDTPYGPVFRLLAYSGMRRGEACALKWSDLDFDRGTVSLAGAVAWEHSKLRITEPKSRSSRRHIQLDSSTLSTLRAHQAQLAEYRIGLPAGVYHDLGLMFGSPTGELLDPDLLTKAWIRLCRSLGVKHRLHDMRHFHASMLLKMGQHLKVVSERLGHSSIAITSDIYSHVLPGLDREPADKFATAMGD